ncbi:hypothetical protein AUR04nite_25050 [Glutamicibacter uratoxydans]|uniref:Uncharacterized protein n=1 Tax=Glutamicibacter uratoxydans TaxID=43667 RepID=A0A4Y4DQR6_GLUUR|nr:hypothetical protein AUR04nite_25050 [Glutamicibacter uratoxydans]
MSNIRCDDGFRLKSLANSGFIGKILVENLDDNGPVQALVHPAIDSRHAAQSEQMVDSVAFIEGSAEVWVGVRLAQRELTPDTCWDAE